MKIKKIDFKKGGGTFLEFSITAVFLTSILIMIVNIFIRRYAIENFELYTTQISRDIVVCSSLDEAQTKAEKEAENLFKDNSNIDYSTLTVEVEYALGSEERWKKGNYIVLTITGDVTGHSDYLPTKYESSNMVMIEKN